MTIASRTQRSKADSRATSRSRASSRAKYHAIVEAASRLLGCCRAEDITISELAREAHVNRTTIYNIFPDIHDVFTIVARQQLLDAADFTIKLLSRGSHSSVFDLIDAVVDIAELYFNERPVARRTLFSTGILSIQHLDASYDILCAQVFWRFAQVDWSIEPFTEQDPFRVVAIILTNMLAIDIVRNDTITPLVSQQAKVAARAYMAEFIRQNDKTMDD